MPEGQKESMNTEELTKMFGPKIDISISQEMKIIEKMRVPKQVFYSFDLETENAVTASHFQDEPIDL